MKLTLPSGARVDVEGASPCTERARFSEAFEAVIKDGDDRIDARDLSLADFHVVRAALTQLGVLSEEEVEIDCHNCGKALRVRPCQQLELGPFRDDELDDPELDTTAELGVPLPILPVPIGRVRAARTVTLEPRTVREAMPLYVALAADSFRIDARVVEAMGIVALGKLENPAQIARALQTPSALSAVADAFLDAHYPPRLASDVFCTECKARNVVDAPYAREFPRAAPLESAPRSFPALEAFVELAHTIADPLIAEIPGEKVELVVEAGVPAVDDGGEPLLGSYVPPPPEGAPVPTRPPRVTIYYRTFETADREDDGFDWEAELAETIEHELEHHVYFLRGDDPLDDEEHAEIDRDVVRVVGRQEATRRTLAVFGTSIPDFIARAWPLIAIGALALVFAFAEGRCN